MPSREDVVREALAWCGTPFHDRAGKKGAGCDCAHLLVRVYAAVGLIEDFDPPVYSAQFFLHRDEPLFLNTVARYAHQVERPQLGDMVMFTYGRQAAHGAILIGEQSIVHAYKPVGRVTKGSMAELVHRVHSYWSPFA